MTINFARLFQDSWNFMRNRPKFSFLFMLFSSFPLFVEQVFGFTNDLTVEQDLGLYQLILLSIFLFYSFINSFIFISINQISQKNFKSVTSAIVETLSRFAGYILSYIIIAIFLASIFSLIMLVSKSISILSVILFFVGVFAFNRICLSPYVYLLREGDVFSCFRLAWERSEKENHTLFIYNIILISLNLLPLIIAKNIDGNELITFCLAILSVFINVFTLIFSYRFYNLFMQRS